ncbi:6-pyruvoyl trahydropterin synthase family protein [Robertkochia sediminum]|uniref:6-pyruvoyl trahydropterin synthase family protein n=1 Tax=Robertkochia sediminum TaxID=2785326 RepID=UPI001933AC78|nr:6-carboxytetrahydropterin synthase [Robertkochia sediminum]MBL7472752.1 6-carboxytetrahydropterin synthase [Robertkochia sediminum]
MRVKVSRKAHFNAAHRLYRKDWSDEKNAEIFGKCNNPHFHGHNYELEVSVTGAIDPETGYVIDMKDLKYLIREQVEQYMDHKNLNEQVEEFKTLNPTAENIAVVIYNRLRPHLKESLDLEVVLYETPRNFVTYSGE